MIITKTPMRMSFFGGGSDIPAYFLHHDGMVISSTFDKYTMCTVRHLPAFFEYSNELVYHDIERVNEVDDIKHPLIRECMKYLDMHDIHLSYDADLPAKTGLGTSSTFAVGLLNAFHSLKGQYASHAQLAGEAIYVERTLCKEAGGCQDQIAAAYGGFNRITFTADGYSVDPVIIYPIRKQRLNNNLMLFFTGISRNSYEVQKDTCENIPDRTSVITEMVEIAKEAEKILVDKDRDLDDFGRLLDYTWNLKKRLSGGISNLYIENIYRRAMEAGAIGGKVLGAGGGGFMLFYVPQEKQKLVREALTGMLYVPFRFEEDGTRVIYFAPEVYAGDAPIKRDLDTTLHERWLMPNEYREMATNE